MFTSTSMLVLAVFCSLVLYIGWFLALWALFGKWFPSSPPSPSPPIKKRED